MKCLKCSENIWLLHMPYKASFNLNNDDEITGSQYDIKYLETLCKNRYKQRIILKDLNDKIRRRVALDVMRLMAKVGDE